MQIGKLVTRVKSRSVDAVCYHGLSSSFALPSFSLMQLFMLEVHCYNRKNEYLYKLRSGRLSVQACLLFFPKQDNEDIWSNGKCHRSALALLNCKIVGWQESWVFCWVRKIISKWMSYHHCILLNQYGIIARALFYCEFCNMKMKNLLGW